jgi:hypothetical protein
MKLKAIGLGALAVAMVAIPALAHHSFAMFDAEKKMTAEGTVKEFQWTNPHSWIVIMVRNQAGTDEQWALELGSPGDLARAGWLPKTLTPGMRVTATFHPLKDGSNGGQFMAIVLPNGCLMGNMNAAPDANAGAGAGAERYTGTNTAENAKKCADARPRTAP